MSSNTFTLGTKSVNRLGYGAMQLAGPEFCPHEIATSL